MNKSKKMILTIFVVVLVITLVIICIETIFQHYTEKFQNDAYIDVWERSQIADIALYSEGTGINEKIYLGSQPLHYLIFENGKIYTYQAGSFKNKITGIRDKASIEYVKTISKSEMKKLENELKLIIENNKIDSTVSSLDMLFNSNKIWYIKINEELTEVDKNVYQNVLKQYFY